jgi:hypothetical protein
MDGKKVEKYGKRSKKQSVSYDESRKDQLALLKASQGKVDRRKVLELLRSGVRPTCLKVRRCDLSGLGGSVLCNLVSNW